MLRVVHARGLGFTYKPTGLRRGGLPPSLVDVSLDIHAGEVFGILGPNGAGKTTLIKILSTLILPDEGALEIFGEPIPGGERAVRRRLGVLLGEYERTFQFRLTGRQNLRFFARFLDVPRRGLEARLEEVLEEVGLGADADCMFLVYSTGMKHRLAVARALLANPDLLVLDEPTAGLDVHTSRQLGDLILRLAREEKATVIYTTHRLEEAGRLCDRIAILRRGRVVAEESPQELRKLARTTSVLALRFQQLDPAFLDACRALPGVQDAFSEGIAGARIHVDSVEETLPAVLALAEGRGLRVHSVVTDEPSVEDAFRRLTQEVEFRVVRA